MENIQEKMKYLTKPGQKASAVRFCSQSFFIVEDGSLQGEAKECKKDYFLFDETGQKIGDLSLVKTKMNEAERKWEEQDGVYIVPEEFFMLVDINITQKQFHGKGLGSMLLNWATKEMRHISDEKKTDLPMLFIRQNSLEAMAFYQKWKAEVNQGFKDDKGVFHLVENNKLGSSCYMIIKKPEPQAKYDAERVGEYEKPATTKDDKKL